MKRESARRTRGRDVHLGGSHVIKTQFSADFGRDVDPAYVARLADQLEAQIRQLWTSNAAFETAFPSKSPPVTGIELDLEAPFWGARPCSVFLGKNIKWEAEKHHWHLALARLLESGRLSQVYRAGARITVKPVLGSLASEKIPPLESAEAPPQDPAAKEGEHEAPKVPDRAARAYSQYLAAIEKDPSLETKSGRAAYEFIAQNLVDNSQEIPNFDTWSRYLRIARSARGEQKHRSRAGRESRSTPHRDQL